MYHNISLWQILLPEIANGNEWFSRHLPSRGTLEDHLDKLEVVLKRLHDAGLKVNAAKSFFCTHEIEYLVTC
jgi:hypothetical protein